MYFTLRLNCDNAAFDGDNLSHELGRILDRIRSEIADDISNGERPLYDTNGDKVGSYRLSGRRHS
jgi:hypothetical protein